MDTRTVAKGSVLGAFAYMAIYAIVAGVWRRVILSDTYESNGFFDFNDPTAGIIVGGLASYLLTGLFLSMVYGHLRAVTGHPPSMRIFFVLGALFWVASDFGYISRHEMDKPALFLGLETVLVAVVFGIFSQVLPRIFRAGA